ncbi:MAG: spore protease YyaC [Lachnospiraceae bacterium]|nr:spore protease YyaC [Lachnospiraceae bacterium]
MLHKTGTNLFYINSNSSQASDELSQRLIHCIHAVQTPWEEIVCLCIGSDRVTGDCLGPLIGHQLSHYSDRRLFVYGTLAYPVHALNLQEILWDIQYMHPAALLIAIDASLGPPKHQGHICIGNGALIPGAGVRKDLPPVGEIFITGIVNFSGISPQLLLSSTRLRDVMHLADSITQGLIKGLKKR